MASVRYLLWRRQGAFIAGSLCYVSYRPPSNLIKYQRYESLTDIIANIEEYGFQAAGWSDSLVHDACILLKDNIADDTLVADTVNSALKHHILSGRHATLAVLALSELARMAEEMLSASAAGNYFVLGGNLISYFGHDEMILYSIINVQQAYSVLKNIDAVCKRDHDSVATRCAALVEEAYYYFARVGYHVTLQLEMVIDPLYFSLTDIILGYVAAYGRESPILGFILVILVEQCGRCDSVFRTTRYKGLLLSLYEKGAVRGTQLDALVWFLRQHIDYQYHTDRAALVQMVSELAELQLPILTREEAEVYYLV